MSFSKKFFIFFCLICVLLSAGFAWLPASKVLALEATYPDINIFGKTYSINDTTSFPEYACYLSAFIMNLAFLITMIVIAYGGVYYLLSYFGGKFTSEGKEWLKAGITGLLIVMCSALIINTINPGLNKCTLAFLPKIDVSPFSNSPTTLSNAPITVYKEIPVGSLTEKLLTRTMDCYGFDQVGDPINGSQIGGSGGFLGIGKQKTYGPTYLNHDREDCLIKLIDGAEKKAHMVAGLADEITKLMNQCNCEGLADEPKCDSACGGQIGETFGCNQPLICPGGSCNGGDCDGGACAGEKDCCPPGIKDQIEHGDIDVSVDVGGATGGECKTKIVKYKGLDEFRCPNPISGAPYKSCENVINFVEEQVMVKDKPVTIINKTKWKKLNLWQQLAYFRDKIEEFKKSINKDKNKLNEAKATVGSSKCYLTTPYVELLNAYEGTNQKDQIILTRKTFTDPVTNKLIDSSKYCQGFNYDNSSCFKKCNDACPDTSAQAIARYASCGKCETGDTDCLKNQEECIEKAYNSRPCISGPNGSQIFYENSGSNNKSNNTSSSRNDNSVVGISSISDVIRDAMNDGWDALKNIPGEIWNAVTGDGGNGGGGGGGDEEGDNEGEDDDNDGGGGGGGGGGESSAGADNDSCINSCQNDCSKNCAKEYLKCSNEYAFCESQCNNNSECVLDKADSCLFGSANVQLCANQITDPGNTNYCINNAYLCKNGSDQYAGYQDCVNSGTEYSSSFLYDNKQVQKCPKPYDPVANDKSGTACQDLYPETTKCPASSDCPSCPCDQIEGTIKFSTPIPDSIGTYGTASWAVSAHQIVGPQCNNYSYNDDPLTFYCEDSWWNKPNKEGTSNKPIGDQRFCPKSREVPVGMAVDNAINWANKLVNDADNLKEDIQIMLTQMTVIGDAIKPEKIVRNYCKCNAQFEDRSPVCKTDCLYKESIVLGFPLCECVFDPCKGKPCQQMTYYLQLLWNYYKNFKDDFTDFYVTMLKEPRSDVMKQLDYSRQTTDNCSLINSAYGPQARLLSCTRVEDELIPPINTSQIKFNNKTVNSYCYGKEVGKLLNESLTDNWFCCEQASKNLELTNQQ